MKLLSVTIPCYNSEAYMRHCIESLLPGGEDVEILIVDDGSTKDHTLEIAQEYQEKYPTIVRAIHQENKGHGGAVNTGIDHATGLYFKVVDSDDWVDAEAYAKILEVLNKIVRGPETVDVVFSNYVYEKDNSRRKKYVMRYPRFMPEDRIFGWNEMKRIDAAHYVLMHSVIFRTELLRETNLRLPEHTFYVDNIFAFKPFVKVEKMYYCNVNLYRYFIGRADQSVNQEVMMRRFPQQLAVNEIMIDYLGEIKGMTLHKHQRQFLYHAMSIIMLITTTMMIRSHDPEIYANKKALWQRLKEADPKGYRLIRGSLQGISMHLPGRGGRKIVEKGYRIAEKIYGFD